MHVWNVSFNIIHFAELLYDTELKNVWENPCKPKRSSYYLESFVDYKKKFC